MDLKPIEAWTLNLRASNLMLVLSIHWFELEINWCGDFPIWFWENLVMFMFSVVFLPLLRLFRAISLDRSWKSWISRCDDSNMHLELTIYTVIVIIYFTSPSGNQTWIFKITICRKSIYKWLMLNHVQHLQLDGNCTSGMVMRTPHHPMTFGSWVVADSYYWRRTEDWNDL